MRSVGLFRRFVTAGLAALVLVSSLTCMTVACRVVCAAERGTTLGSAAPAEAALPACHGAAAGGSSTASVPAGGDCTSGTVCCSTWLHDRDVYVMPAPALVLERGADDVPVLLSATSLVAAPSFVARAPQVDPPGFRPSRPAGPRAGRAPPAA